MEHLINFITQHASHAHWLIFLSLLLAGCNIPISIDVVMILSAILASSFAPENTAWLFASVLLGCTFSAWIAYFIGKFAGDKLVNAPLFSKLLKPSKLEKIQAFYAKYGIWTFIIGRFIPFGVRNCIFMTSGMSKMPFKTFAMRDAVGCTIWTTCCFTLFYFIGQNFAVIWAGVKTFNLIIFTAFSVTVIAISWYKLKKNKRIQSENKTL
ncbi:MAG: DedA family protein [Chlamydiae bacterium]|nr:DedA family protein [Chlamydiota bacterium]